MSRRELRQMKQFQAAKQRIDDLMNSAYEGKRSANFAALWRESQNLEIEINRMERAALEVVA